MKSKYTFLARLQGGKFVAVQFRKKLPVFPEGATSFYVRYSEDGKRYTKPMGVNMTTAYIEVQNLQARKLFADQGLPANFELIARPTEGAMSDDSIPRKGAIYLEEIMANKSRKTYLAYRRYLQTFSASCKAPSVRLVTREDLLAYKTYLRAKEYGDRSVYNHFLNAMVFLKWCGVKVGIRKADWPPKTVREPEEYTDDQLSALFKAAASEDRLILKSFLYSGVRSGELAHLTYGDIDFKHSVWTIQPHAGWNVKTAGSQRDVPVPDWHTQKIAERMIGHKRAKTDLVFPATNGGPDVHLLRIVKSVAKRAKLTGRVDDHKFRSTAITRWLREGNSVQDVMRWVGHKDLNTILRYAAKVNVRSAETQRKASSAFAHFAAVGGD